jgi:hypothetical protein
MMSTSRDVLFDILVKWTRKFQEIIVKDSLRHWEFLCTVRHGICSHKVHRSLSTICRATKIRTAFKSELSHSTWETSEFIHRVFLRYKSLHSHTVQGNVHLDRRNSARGVTGGVIMIWRRNNIITSTTILQKDNGKWKFKYDVYIGV